MDDNLIKLLPYDLVGKRIMIGDTIAYGLVIGRSANLCIYKVEDIVFVPTCGQYISQENPPQRVYGQHLAPKLKVTKLIQSYGRDSGRSTIAMMERVLVINETALTWRHDANQKPIIPSGR